MKSLLINLSIFVLVLSSVEAIFRRKLKCGPCEIYKSCGGIYQQTCEDFLKGSLPNIATPAVCVSGCFCKDGFVRNATGNCIEKSMCPPIKCEDPNAHFGRCKDLCPVTCENRNNIPMCTRQCALPGECQCKPGYVRDANNRCISPELCPSKNNNVCPTDPNAVVTPCGDPCPTTCKNKNSNTPKICPRICKRNGCRCKEGFVKGPYGLCISPESCPSENNNVCPTDPNAVVTSCGDPCPTTCENKDSTAPKICPRICEINGCQCKKGFVKGPYGLCISPESCPSENNNVCPTDPNAVVTSCGDPCPTTCENKDSAAPKICPRICKINGCQCKKGFVQGPDGLCISPESCPSENNKVCPTDPNAVVTPCGDPCPTTCENKDSDTPKFCPRICKINGCQCKEGFIKGPNGLCISPESCPLGNEKVCPTDPNAVVTPCGNTCPTTCENKDSTAPRNCSRICEVNGCHCNDGYVLGPDGLCILPESCPSENNNVCPTDPNAVVTPCGDSCPTTCENKDSTAPRICPRICKINGCQCKKGFIQGPDGLCISPESCPKTCKNPNEVFNHCGDVCPTTCENKDKQMGCPMICNPGACVCRSGYVRDSNNRCVLPEECPTLLH